MTLAPVDPLQGSDIQNRKRTDLYCFKPLSVWELVTAAMITSTN